MKSIEDFVGKIICGNCLEVMKEIPNESIQMILTDPPYGIEYHSCHYKHGNPHKKIIGDDEIIFPIKEYWRLIQPCCAIYSFYSYKKPIQCKEMKNQLIWVKNNWTAGDLLGDFANQYECIAFIPKGDFRFWHGKRLSNVFFDSREKPEYHPTQKPLSLLKKLINFSTDYNDIILDPFMGSGSTILAAEMLGRRWIGIEINPDYCKIAQERLDIYRCQKKIEF